MRTRVLLVMCALGLGGGVASAQPSVVPTVRPPVSPYLNLLRPGNSPGVNYYGLVRPQVEFRSNIQNLQRQVASNQDALAGLNQSLPPTTGHATTFLNTGGYYPGRLGGPVGTRPVGGAGAQPANRSLSGRR